MISYFRPRPTSETKERDLVQVSIERPKMPIPLSKTLVVKANKPPFPAKDENDE
jgi:hypothetical protein